MIWTWSIGGIIRTGENRSTSRKNCSSDPVFITNSTWTGLELHLGYNTEGPATDCLRGDMPEDNINIIRQWTFSGCRMWSGLSWLRTWSCRRFCEENVALSVVRQLFLFHRVNERSAALDLLCVVEYQLMNWFIACLATLTAAEIM
jgi:hypothetical protein